MLGVGHFRGRVYTLVRLCVLWCFFWGEKEKKEKEEKREKEKEGEEKKGREEKGREEKDVAKKGG